MKRSKASLRAQVVAALAAMALLASAPSASAEVSGDPGWSEPTTIVTGSGETNLNPAWRCAAGTCSYTGSTTHFTATAVNGATFTPISDLNLVHIFTQVGKCNGTAAAIDCAMTKNITQTNQPFRISPTSAVRLHIPVGAANGTKLAELGWLDAATTGNDPSNDAQDIVYANATLGDWGHERQEEFRAAGLRAGGIDLTCLAEFCVHAATTEFFATALNGTSLADPVGTTLPLVRRTGNPGQTAVSVGSCEVETTTRLACAPSSLASVPAGGMLTSNASYEIPAGLAEDTPVLEITWSDAGATGNEPANDLRVVRSALGGVALDEPIEVFSELFEHGQGATPTLVDTHVGPPPLAQTYLADTPWLELCNGVIASELNPDNSLPPSLSDCDQSAGDPDGTLQGLRAMAWLAGTLDEPITGVDPMTNHAVSAYTNGNPGAPFVQLETAKPIPVTPGRFYAAGLTAVAFHCTSSHPLIGFELVDGANVVPVTDQPADPCAEADVVEDIEKIELTGWAARFTSDTPAVLSGSEARIRVVNHQASGAGNDGAIDTLRLLDVSPRLEKSFVPDAIGSGENATLRFTVANSADLLPKEGWSFTDELPAGLTIAPGEQKALGCGDATLDAPVGGRAISVGDGRLDRDQEACSISVQVTAKAGGAYENCPANFSAVSGLRLPACARLSVAEGPGVGVRQLTATAAKRKPKSRKRRPGRSGKPELVVRKSASTSFARPGSVIRYEITVWNKGRRAARQVTVCDRPPAQQRTLRSQPRARSSAAPCWRLARLAPGAKRRFALTSQVGLYSSDGMQRNVAVAKAANAAAVRRDAARVRVEALPGSACLSSLRGRADQADFDWLC